VVRARCLSLAAARRAVFVAVVALSVACGQEVATESVSAEVVAFGRFEIVDGRLVLAEETTRIVCEPGALFGIDYRVDVEGLHFGGVLPIEFRWRHPEFAIPSKKLWGEESPAGLARPVLEWGESSLSRRAIWRLEHPDERKDGRYEFLVRIVGSERVLASQVFDVEGC